MWSIEELVEEATELRFRGVVVADPNIERRLVRLESKINLLASAIGFVMFLGVAVLAFAVGDRTLGDAEWRDIGIGVLFALGYIAIPLWRINQELPNIPPPAD